MSTEAFPFFITGLPRSRTAWLANLFTTGGVFCFHDALRECGRALSPERLQAMLRSAQRDGGYSLVGDSDSGLVANWEQIDRQFPAARWLIVTRPEAACRRSYQQYFSGRHYPGLDPAREEELPITFHWLNTRLAEAKRGLGERALQIDYDLLDDAAAVRASWQWLLGAQAPHFDERRFKQLRALQINILPEKLEATAPAQSVA